MSRVLSAAGKPESSKILVVAADGGGWPAMFIAFGIDDDFGIEIPFALLIDIVATSLSQIPLIARQS